MCSIGKFVVFVSVAIGIAAPPAGLVFVDVTADSGITFRNHNSATPEKYLIETMTGGVALLDYDGDGLVDVFFTNGARLNAGQSSKEPLEKAGPEFWNRLYRNLGKGKFEDVTEKAGVQGHGYSMGAAVGDVDNDGDPDLLVTNFGSVILYRNNGDGTFTDETAKAGLGAATGWFTSAGFFDYDRDGKLDLFLCRYLKWTLDDNKYCGSREAAGRSYCHPDNFKPVSNQLYRNAGDGIFTDVSAKAGIAKLEGKALGVAFADFDNDGWIDITVANDSFPQFLLQNNKDGTFTDNALLAGSAYDEDGRTFAGMGTEAADLDDDGWTDIVTTTLSNERYAHFRNTGDGSFLYASQESGIADITRLLAGWGVRAVDFNLDGVKDLFFANSHVMDNITKTQPHVRYEQPPSLLLGAGKRFLDVSANAGEIFKRPLAARGAAAGDLDNDGDIDIVLAACNGPAVILRNDGGNRNAWFALKLEGRASNRDAIGAKVVVTTAAGRVQHHMVTTTASYQSAQDPRLSIGLGQESAVKEIAITWPNGNKQKLTSPPLRRLTVVVEGR